jgi:Protein of unknown function (DUF4058)
MPIHDWTRVDAGLFHHFHVTWVGELAGKLNSGIMPATYYALTEQWAGEIKPDVLTLRVESNGESHSTGGPEVSGGVAVAEAEPKVRIHVQSDPNLGYAALARRIAVRHVSDDSLVSVIEIVSAANKDRESTVAGLVGKVVGLLAAQVHVLLVDLLPPGRHDPTGIHGAVWDNYGREPYVPPADCPLTLAAYVAHERMPEGFIEPTAIGRPLIDMPLFLNEARYVNVPLEPTYQSAYQKMPAQLRSKLESPTRP